MVKLTRDRVVVAADALARGMLDEPSGRWLVPEPTEFLIVFRHVYTNLIRLALDEGRVDVWGDPLVGVAVWLRRPALADEPPPDGAGAAGLSDGVFPAHALGRVERYAAVIRQLREHVRPDEHAYLDTIAVLPSHRGHGIASRLLEAGHAWADEADLPCALETETKRNVEFYQRRGYEVRAESPVSGSELLITAMRRSKRR
jgi:GNAT superfamily N-acetyltransferase